MSQNGDGISPIHLGENPSQPYNLITPHSSTSHRVGRGGRAVCRTNCSRLDAPGFFALEVGGLGMAAKVLQALCLQADVAQAEEEEGGYAVMRFYSYNSCYVHRRQSY